MTTLIECFGLSHLSGEQKRELGIALLDEADKIEGTIEIPESFRKELRRCSADIDANPDDSVPWHEVREQIRKKYDV